MPELPEIVPRPARVTKQGRCAEGLCVKTMLCDGELRFRVVPRAIMHPFQIGELSQSDVLGSLAPRKNASRNARADRRVIAWMFNAVSRIGFNHREVDDFKESRNIGQIVERDPNAVDRRGSDDTVYIGANRNTLDQRVPFGLGEFTIYWIA